MSPRGDLMERLAAADPRPDAERLSPEEQSEADALLARLLATPAEGHGVDHRLARPRIRRWALAATGALCSAAAAFAAVNLLDSDTPGPDVVEKAVAAVTRGGVIYHVLERATGRSTGIPDVGQQTFYFESWHTTGGRVHRKTFAARGGHRGKLLEEFAGRRLPGRRGGPLLRWEVHSNTISEAGFAVGSDTSGPPRIDPFGDPGTALRTLEQQGRLRLAGTTRVGNRTAYRLVSGVVPGTATGEKDSVEFLVDSQTYLPLVQRHRVGGSERGITFVTRYLVYERTPLNARSRRQLDLDPHPGAKCSENAGKLKGRRAEIGFPNPCAR
jgi:hypothetical protein